MRRLLVIVMGVLAGCTQHQPPDDTLSVELRRASEATMTAMAVPEAQRPSGRALDDQVRLLACRLDAAQADSVRAGRVARTAVVTEYRETLKRRATRESSALPPKLLTHLVEQTATWSVDQTLLAAALLAQYQDEAKLRPPLPELTR